MTQPTTTTGPGADDAFGPARESLGRWLRRKGLDPEQAEDLAQAACLRALETPQGALPGRPLLPWLATIAGRLLIDRARRAERRPLHLARTPTSAAPPDLAARREEVARLHAAVARLDPEPRRLIELFYAEGLGTEEIGRRLGLPRGTVKSRLHRARARLAESLQEQREPT